MLSSLVSTSVPQPLSTPKRSRRRMPFSAQSCQETTSLRLARRAGRLQAPSLGLQRYDRTRRPLPHTTLTIRLTIPCPPDCLKLAINRLQCRLDPVPEGSIGLPRWRPPVLVAAPRLLPPPPPAPRARAPPVLRVPPYLPTSKLLRKPWQSGVELLSDNQRPSQVGSTAYLSLYQSLCELSVPTLALAVCTPTPLRIGPLSTGATAPIHRSFWLPTHWMLARVPTPFRTLPSTLVRW